MISVDRDTVVSSLGFQHRSAAEVAPDPAEVAIARAYLLELSAGDYTRRPRHSYSLKHEAERWAGTYVSNGALIQAAFELGFHVRRIPGSLNAHVSLHVRCIK